MPSTPIQYDDYGYLVDCRRQVVSSLDGLDDYSIRRPMTLTGTNLLGVMKHLIGIEAGYLGVCLGRPFDEPLPWIDEAEVANRDMWATADESRDDLVGLYGRACAHSDAVLAEIGRAAPALVPWWPEESRTTTSGALLARVLKDTAMHAGQLQVLRELIDGRAGTDRDEFDGAWWRAYTDRLEQVASRFRTESAGGGRYGARVDAATDIPGDAPFDPELWRDVEGFDFTDITYHRAVEAPVVRIAFDRPEVRNAFRPHTVDELYRALEHARTSSDVGCVLITGNGPSVKDGGWAFCSGGDQRIRGRSGYTYNDDEAPEQVDPASQGRLHILEVQRLIRFMPKVVIALVNGWAAGGGHSLHVVCDLTLASAEHARFKQTDADVGSFDGGFGSAYLARQVGQKFARQIFFLGETYDADEGHRMGTVNAVVPHADLERVGLEWGKKVCAKSPTAQRMLKYSFNAIDDGLVGQQVFAGEATRLAYMTDEAVEGRDAFLEKRAPDFSAFPYYY